MDSLRDGNDGSASPGQHKHRGEQPHDREHAGHDSECVGELPGVSSAPGSSPERRAEREGDVECRHDQETDRQDHGHSWAGGSPLGVC